MPNRSQVADIQTLSTPRGRFSRAETGFLPALRETPTGSSLDRGGDRGAEVLGPGVAAEIRRAGPALGEHLGDRPLDGSGSSTLAKMLEHHGSRPDLADRVGDAAAGNVGCRAMHRLEHRGVFARGVDVARGCY